MTAPLDLRPTTWVSHDGVIVTIFHATGPDGDRFYVQVCDHGQTRPACDPHGYHKRRVAERAARRLFPEVI